MINKHYGLIAFGNDKPQYFNSRKERTAEIKRLEKTGIKAISIFTEAEQKKITVSLKTNNENYVSKGKILSKKNGLYMVELDNGEKTICSENEIIRY